MIDTTDIKKMVTHILRRQRGVPDREAIDPGREWLLGVVATIVLVVLGGMVSYGFYLNTISLEVDIDRVAAVAIPYNAAIVDQAVLEFRTRAEAYTAIRGTAEVTEELPVTATTTEPAAVLVPIESTKPVVESTSTEAIDVPPKSDPLPAEPRTEEAGARPDLGV